MSSTPGYHISIHKALTTPILLAGAPRRFTLLNATCCAALFLGLHSFYALPLCGILQILMAHLTQKDSHFLAVVLRHLKQKKYYGV